VTHRDALLRYFKAAVRATGAELTLPPLLPTTPAQGRTIVLAYGKAAADMALVAARHLTGRIIGCAVTRHGHGLDLDGSGIELIEARHPVPDTQSLEAGMKMLALAASAGKDDRVIFLASGGGSALLCAPPPGVSLREKQELTDGLVRSGVSIDKINLVRRHLSQIKGGHLGGLAAARGAKISTFVISDVVGDDPALIASGPSISAPVDPDCALSVLKEAGLEVSDSITRALYDCPTATAPPHPVHVLATNQDALAAATALARKDGWTIVDAGQALSGDAAQWGQTHADMALSYVNRPGRFLLVSGGELTVKNAKQDGRGGPNLEYLTGLLSRLPPDCNIEAMACDTDGIDGTQDNAGGYLHAAWADTCDAREALRTNRTYDLFKALGGLVMTGPTRTNVNDIRMIAIEGAKS
jgi:hydroxypyruvate reductase